MNCCAPGQHGSHGSGNPSSSAPQTGAPDQHQPSGGGGRLLHYLHWAMMIGVGWVLLRQLWR